MFFQTRALVSFTFTLVIYTFLKDIPVHAYIVCFATSALSMSLPNCYWIPVHAYHFYPPYLLCLRVFVFL